MTLGETDAVYRNVPCCKANQSAKHPVYIEMRSTLEHMFGAEVWRRLDKALMGNRSEK